jgi:hypothetical protein
MLATFPQVVFVFHFIFLNKGLMNGPQIPPQVA